MNTNPPRGSARYKLARALTRPHRILPHFIRTFRNALINLTSRDAIEAHRRFIEDYGKNDPNRAVGSDSQEHWLAFGKKQFEFLLEHGLHPDQHVLEIGCGNLRLGWRLIQYLQEGRYTGIEISPFMLELARRKISEYSLQTKRPYLFLVEDVDYGFLPQQFYSCINAHAVFTQAPLEAIARVVPAVTPLLKSDGFFDFTYYETSGEPYAFQGVHYYHRREDVAAIIEKTGLTAEWIPAFDRDQAKVRVRRSAD